MINSFLVLNSRQTFFLPDRLKINPSFTIVKFMASHFVTFFYFVENNKNFILSWNYTKLKFYFLRLLFSLFFRLWELHGNKKNALDTPEHRTLTPNASINFFNSLHSNGIWVALVGHINKWAGLQAVGHEKAQSALGRDGGLPVGSWRRVLSGSMRRSPIRGRHYNGWLTHSHSPLPRISNRRIVFYALGVRSGAALYRHVVHCGHSELLFRLSSRCRTEHLRFIASFCQPLLYFYLVGDVIGAPKEQHAAFNSRDDSSLWARGPTSWIRLKIKTLAWLLFTVPIAHSALHGPFLLGRK